jgi:AcrR family transcriptional regulator
VAISEPTKRRRRSPAQARTEIIDAATRLLAELPSHEVTVSAIMSATTLSRKSFYGYFRDRAALLAELIAPLRAETDAAVAHWRESDDMVGAGRQALRRAAILYRRHGAVLRALAAASERDEDAATVWRSVIEPVVTVAAEKIAIASTELDPRRTAEALVCMNVHYLLDRMPTASPADLDTAVTTLTVIWERTLFLAHPN